jgi:hypothetical protein
MSAQTGEEIPAGPASTRVGDRLRFRVARWIADPNPIWIRELRQSVRLARTPFILMALTILVTLGIAAIGGSASEREPSDEVGGLLFQTFFSIGYFVVALVGPALAANAIASEREGRTWEAIVLAGLGPKVIGRGKFLSAFSDVAAYIVMLAPVGALPFLFGGVHWLEVVIGFVILFAIAALSVAFGLALSSKMASSRGAILATLLLAIPMSGFLYGMGGPGLSFLAHELFPQVLPGRPVWLPMAYVRGEMGSSYVLALFVVPVMVFALPGWLLYEATIANLTEPSDDRSTGLKRWFLVTSVALLGSAVVAHHLFRSDSEVIPALWIQSPMWLAFLGFVIVMFTGEPLGPTRRILFRWQRAGAGAAARFFGPGLMLTLVTVLAVGVTGFALMAASAITRAHALAAARPGMYGYGFSDANTLAFVAYGAGFLTFLVGLAAWLRARSNNVLGARIVFLALVFGISVVPWIGAAIVGLASRSDDAVLVASPSPFFAALLIDHPKDAQWLAGVACAAGWAGIGLLLLLAARRRVNGMMAAFDAHFAQAEAALAAEAAAAAEPGPAPETTAR